MNTFDTSMHAAHRTRNHSMSEQPSEEANAGVASPYDTREADLMPLRISAEKVTSHADEENEKEGLYNSGALTFLALWYFFSALTLYLNKYIVDMKQGDTALLGMCQMVMTTLGGAVNMQFPCGMYKPVKRVGKPPNFYRNMMLVGACRFCTVIFGLIALKYVAVSFTETVKSSAPIFTVVIARVLMGETTTSLVLTSLVPIMAGLALTSAYEISFNIIGFMAALSTNISECVQNVYSKKLISNPDYKYTPAEMQFYTSLCSMVFNIPVALLMMNYKQAYDSLSWEMALALFMNGIFFHFQTITAYGLMGYISPVTHSVANTVKRALMIWVSIPIFGNEVTLLAGVGMVLVTGGVFLYNKARELDASSQGNVHDKA